MRLPPRPFAFALQCAVIGCKAKAPPPPEQRPLHQAVASGATYKNGKLLDVWFGGPKPTK